MRRRAREDWSKLDGCVYKVESERVRSVGGFGFGTVHAWMSTKKERVR